MLAARAQRASHRRVLQSASTETRRSYGQRVHTRHLVPTVTCQDDNSQEGIRSRFPQSHPPICRLMSRFPILRAFKADQIPPGGSLGPASARRNPFEQHLSPDESPSVSVPSYLLLPTIPPELQIPLSFLGGGASQIQISDVEATDLDMRSYVLE